MRSGSCRTGASTAVIVIVIACIAACGGRVQGPGGPGSGSSAGGGTGGAAGGGGAGGLDGTDDAGASDDGWSGPGANMATGPAPACSEVPPQCGALAPAPTMFATSEDAANAIVGRWAFCPGGTSGFYPADQLGEEYASDGTYYELVPGPNGQLVRDADPRSVGTWEVKLGDQGAVEVHTYGNGVQRSVDLSACPRALDALGLEVPAP